MRTLCAALLITTAASTAAAPERYTGLWNGVVPASVEIIDAKTLRFCREDLLLQCVGPVPYMREGDVIVVEHLSDGLKWTYSPRPDGGFDAQWLRWNGSGYTLLATAVLSGH
ncbi:MAG: hypothetical protein AAF439_07425 [Pseudomonadota bacterium]